VRRTVALMSERSPAGLLVWLLAAALVGLALWRLMGSGGPAAGSPVRVDRGPAQAVSGGGSRAARLFVHVAGAVRRPGLVKMAHGARVAEAIERAGGPVRRADLAGVNLAAEVEDGQQVVVPARGAALAASAGSVGGAGAASAGASGAGSTGAGALPFAAAGAVKPSLGTVTLEQLDAIDGIGPTLAQRIVEYRTERGGFRSLGELREVDGIGEKRFEALSQGLQP
jgi:competence protein ComEA